MGDILLFIKNKFEHKGLKKYGLNIFWILLGKSVGWAISFFVIIYLVRYLGPEKYGVLSYAFGFAAIFAAIARMGVDGNLVRDLVKFSDEKDVFLGSAMFIKFIGGLLACFVGILTALFIDGFTEITLFISILLITFFIKPLEAIDIFFQSKVKGKTIAFVDIIEQLVKSILLFVGIILNLSLVYFIFSYAISWVSKSLALLFFYLKGGNDISKLKYENKIVKKLWNSSWPLLLNGILALILSKIDVLMINNFLDNTQTGLYSAAVRLGEFWYVIPSTILLSLFPAIVRSYERNIAEYKRRARHLTFFVMGISIIVSSFIAIFSSQIISILYGSDFIEAAPVLSIYVWSSLGMILTTIMRRDLLVKENVKPIFWFSLLSVIVNIILNTIFIPRYGIYGATYTTLISSFVFAFCYVVLINKDKKYV